MSALAAAAVLAAAWARRFSGPAATRFYRVVDGAVESGETIRSNGGAGAMLALADGSRVEMRSQSELSLERADDGIADPPERRAASSSTRRSSATGTCTCRRRT